MNTPMGDPDRRAYLTARTSIGDVPLSAWPRTDKSLRLVELETEWVRLSTQNHRTKAEQQREAQRQGQDDLFTADPLGPTAQEWQLTILAGQSKFGQLKEDLLARGQQEPAIVTADGVLINGNRRTAALRTLKREGHLQFSYVRCLVLPSDATAEEILTLEAELQVARDFREDYSWINEAMMIEELYELSGRDWDQTAKRMHRAKKDVQGQYEKLLLVQQLVNQSQGTRLPIDFTENETAFDELAKYIRNKPRAEAEGVKTAYFLGVLSGVNYRQLRHLRCEDAQALVDRELEGESGLAAIVDTARTARAEVDEDDLLSDLMGEDAPRGSVVEDVLRLVVTRRPEAVVELPDGGSVPMQSVLNSLSGVVSSAAREADERNREQDAVEAPFQRADKAFKELDRIPALLRRARAHSAWDEEAFQGEIDRIDKLVAKIRETS
ncbi:ParB N-terminal domain-containing protein [Streptomyces sp. NBC_01275]|uniref:ParB N-terminal domain-containing protein n=1 Tax=Streptomyces sp. NBC_01275 TaxID=2903807 RepID=UPI00225864C4|nr:ParB N-terminal domain-containing protein [Streptomyces sp. NBC_01275]MCX4762426.1 ParB N-terminal domain-containing protein [Streptomyces sp. NBC_01275]